MGDPLAPTPRTIYATFEERRTKMHFDFPTAISLISALAPFLFALAQLLVSKLPANRQSQVLQLAGIAVHSIEQQANGGWSSEQKYAAAAQALEALAKAAGLKVNDAEAKAFIEAAVLALHGVQSVVSKRSAPDASSAAQSSAPSQIAADAL